jgi:transposase
MLLYSCENLPERRREEFGRVKKTRLSTVQAWAIKESLRNLWTYQLPDLAQIYFESWGQAIRSRLKSSKAVEIMFPRSLLNIITIFKHLITLAVSESLNSPIQMIKKKACGFFNREHLKIATYFHCGGLNLLPVTHNNAG